jgi:hypothetical protein
MVNAYSVLDQILYNTAIYVKLLYVRKAVNISIRISGALAGNKEALSLFAE